MNNKLISHSLSTLRIIAISSLTIFTLYTVQAWVSPTVSAPNGNVGGPLTTATTTQVKTGSLGLLDNLSVGKDLIVNGGFRLTTGAASGTVLTSDASGNASWVSSTGGGSGAFGPGYVWQDLKASRVLGTTYTNSTSNPIVVSVSTTNTGTCQMFSYVNSVVAGFSSDSNGGFPGDCGGIETIVPSGQTYKITGRAGSTIYTWSELRCDSGVNCGSGPNVPGSLGVGQTWQNMVGSAVGCASPRTFNVLCTNNTGKPISVIVNAHSATTYTNLSATVGGVILPHIDSSGGNYVTSITFIVPNGQTYKITASNSPILSEWTELR